MNKVDNLIQYGSILPSKRIMVQGSNRMDQPKKFIKSHYAEKYIKTKTLFQLG